MIWCVEMTQKQFRAIADFKIYGLGLAIAVRRTGWGFCFCLRQQTIKAAGVLPVWLARQGEDKARLYNVPSFKQRKSYYSATHCWLQVVLKPEIMCGWLLVLRDHAPIDCLYAYSVWVNWNVHFIQVYTSRTLGRLLVFVLDCSVRRASNTSTIKRTTNKQRSDETWTHHINMLFHIYIYIYFSQPPRARNTSPSPRVVQNKSILYATISKRRIHKTLSAQEEANSHAIC